MQHTAKMGPFTKLELNGKEAADLQNKQCCLDAQSTFGTLRPRRQQKRPRAQISSVFDLVHDERAHKNRKMNRCWTLLTTLSYKTNSNWRSVSSNAILHGEAKALSLVGANEQNVVQIKAVVAAEASTVYHFTAHFDITEKKRKSR
jgi:hypothetical protein